MESALIRAHAPKWHQMAQTEKGFAFSFYVVLSSLSLASEAVTGTPHEKVDNMSSLPTTFTRHAVLLHGKPQFNIMESWMNNWSSARSRLVEFRLTPANKLPSVSDLLRKEWSTLSRLRTEFGCFNYFLSK